MFTSQYDEPTQEVSSFPLNNTFSIESFGNIDHSSESSQLFVFSSASNTFLKFSDAISSNLIDPSKIYLIFNKENDIKGRLSLSDAIYDDLIDINQGLIFFPNGNSVSLTNMFSSGLIEGLDHHIELRMLSFSDSFNLKPNTDIISEISASNSFSFSNLIHVESVWDNMIGEGILKIDAPNVANKYTENIKNELDNLKTIEEKLLKETTVFLSEKENQLLIDEFQDINNEFTVKKDPILSLVHKVEKFLSKNSDNIPIEQERNLLSITNDLKMRTNQTQKEIDHRSRLLFGINDESVQFFNKLNDCNTDREKLENSIQITSNIPSTDHLEKAIVDLKLLDGEFVSYHNDIRVLNGFKIKFVDKIIKLEEYRKKFSESLKIPIESTSRSKTEQEINDLTNEVIEGQKSVHDLYKSKLSLLKDACENFENLKDNLKNVDEIIRIATEELDNISSLTENLSVHLLLPYANDLHRLNGEITGVSRIIKEIENVLPNTIKSLEKVGVTKSNLNSLSKSIDISINNFTTITERLHGLLKEINKQSISDKDTVDSVNNLDHWINEIDNRIKNIGPLSLDHKVLSEQERLIQTLHAEIDGRHPVLENLLKNVDSSNKLQVENLERRVKHNLLAASNIIKNTNDLRKLLDSFNNVVKSCSEWVMTTTEFLTDRMFTRLDNENFGEKLSEIKNEYDKRQNDIEQARQISSELLRQENCKDRSCVDTSIENLEKVWLSLGDLIKTRTKELTNRENYFDKYSELKDKIITKLNNWEQTMSMNSPLAIDLSALQNQYESIDNFIKEWNSSKSEINEFCIVGSEYDSILQGFPLGGDQHNKITSPQRRPSKFSEVILEIDDIKSRYSELGDQLLNRRTDINELLNKCKLFEKDYNEFSIKLNTQLIQLLSVENENLNKNDEIAQYEKLEEDIKSLRPELMSILFAGQDLIRHRELVPGGVEMRSNLDELEKKFNSLKDTSKKQLNLRRNIDSQLKKFQDMKKSIENNIMRKERMLNVLGPVGTSVSYGNAQLQQVNALIDEVEGLEYDLKELNDVGKDIIRSMSPTASEVDEIESTLDTLSKKVNNLNKLLKDRESNINAVMGPSKDFYKLINSVSDRLALLQEKIDRNDVNVLTSFDWEEIQTELDNIKALLHDSENLSKTLLESISDENIHYEIKNKVNNLSRNCREIQWKIDHSVNMIGKRSQQEDTILRKIEDSEKWLQQKQELVKLLSLESNEIPSNLSDNIRQLQIYQGDIKHKSSQLNDLYTEINRINEEKSPTHKSKQIHEKLDQLLDVIGKIESDINNLTDVYQQASVDLSKINNETNKIEAWIDIEKHKMNKQYPIGLESIDAEIKLLEATIRSIENKNQQLQDLKNFITPPNNVNSAIILSHNLSSLNKIETDLKDLQLESQDKLELLKKIQEQIGSTSENLNYLKSSLLKLETKGNEYSKIEESVDKPIDVSKLEAEIKSIQSEMHLIKPDIENTKSIIASIAQISPVNATLLEPEMDKIANRYQILSSSLSQKLIFLNSKHKAMDECKNRIEIFATRQKNLKEKIDNFPQSSLDLDSLEDQIQDLNSLNREANEMENSLANLKSEVNNLADHNIESADKSKQKIDLLNSNNEQIKELIDDRQNSLILQHKIVTEFETKKKDLNRKIDEANNDPELGKLMNNKSKNISTFTQQKIEPLKKQLEEVINIGNNACSTVVSGLGYKHIEQEMDLVKHNFDKLMQIVSDIENHVDIKLMKEQKFDASLKNLKEFVMNISKDLKSEEEPSIEYHKSKSQLNSHRLLLDRLKKRRSSLDELNKTGADLLVTMKEPKKSQLENDLDDLNRKYENLLNIAEEKNCRYDRAVKLSKSFKDFYEPSLVWLDTAEKNLANFDTSPTVDTIEMDKRIQDYKNLVKEIKSHEETLKNLNQVGEDLMKVSTENDSAAINNKINTLHNYFDEISANAVKKLSLFESSIPIAERFLLANNKLDLVLPSLTALVRENDSLTGQIGERNMEILENETSSVEKLVSQARNDLNKLKSVDAFENSLEKVEDLFVENEKRFKEVLNEVTRKATEIGSNRTKAKIQEENLEECLEVLSDFEHKINDINDKINNDYSNLEEYKEEFINLLGAWNEHKEAINTTINDSKKLIRQAPGSDLKSLRSSIDLVKKQCQTISKTFENQQQKLDEIIPLAKEFTTSYNKLKDWLVETEENMYQNKINNLDPDQLHKAEQEIKVLANSWEDQKPLLDIIIKAGHPLSQIVNRVQGKQILANIEEAKKRYNNIKEFIKTRATDLEDLISINTELNEKVDQCANQIEIIKERISDSYQPSVHPEKLEEELGIFDEIIYDLEKLQSFVDKLQVGIENCSPSRKKFDDPTEESIELLEKLTKISSSNKELQQQSLDFKEKIKDLLKSANEFWNDLNDTEENFNKISVELTNSTIEDLNARSVNDKKKLIENLRSEIDVYDKNIEKIIKKGNALIEQVNNPNETPDIEQAEEELKRNFENVRSACDQQIINIDRQQSLINKLEEMRMKLDEWFKEQNNRLFILGPLPTETRPVLTQIEKTKELKNEIEPKHRDIEMINQLGYQLTKGSHPNIKNQVNNTLLRINDSWARLLDGLGQRQHQLQCILLSLGEFHRAVDEFIEWIIATEKSLSNIKIEHGDINSLEMGLAQHKMIRADMNISQASVSKIERKAAEIIKEDVTSLGHEATQRLEQLRTSWEALKEHIRFKHFELEDALKEALIFYGDQQEISKNIDELGSKLDVFKFSGGLPDTAKEQLKRFMDIYRTFPKLNSKIDRFVEDSSEISKKSSSSIAKTIEIDTANILKKWNAVKALAESRKTRLEKAIETVETFHLDMAKFINWVTLTEKNLNQQRPVSRIVPTILDQIEAHRALKRDIMSHRDEMLNLDKMATHLKYISQKHDIVLIRNLMSSIHHRWEKVVSRSSERSRNLDYGFKEAKRFEDMNKALLDDIAQNLAFLEQDTSIGQTPSKIREQIARHKEFHCNLGVHNLTYDATRRLGYQLRDKAPLQDSKKIDEIVHNLQMKWQNLCNKSIEREKALNDALLVSGNYKDAMTNLLSWLHAIEPKLNDTSKGCGGDINTVKNLLSEHATIEKQLRDRDHMIEKINTDAMTLMIKSEEDSSFIEEQLAELKSLWNNVNNLSNEKRERLEYAKTQAIEFELQWNGLKEFFSKAEHDLRQFTMSPEEEREDAITTMISNHNNFHKNLLLNENKINDFQQFGHEILASAYPGAEGPIKHYINIIKSQWSELLGWSEQRGQNLKEHLHRLNERKILLDDLLLWLAAAEGTLSAAESRELPRILNEAKFQYDEHERFITDMTLKQRDHDEIVTNSKKKASIPVLTHDRNKKKELEINPSLSKIQDPIYINPKVNQLHSKWKQVWFMILNRRKNLLEHIDYLKQVDNMKNFNFDEWRQRYMSWMNHSKSRVMDFFRRQDTDHDGRVTRKEFIDGILDSKFQTTRVEMEVVADIFDKEKSGFIDYRQFLAALRPDREIYQVKPINENEIIHDEVKKQISKCSCRNPYKITQCGDGKYKFGDTEKLRLVRILRSNVMVRIGGGWCALDEFLVKHDPCREAFVPEPSYTSELAKNWRKHVDSCPNKLHRKASLYTIDNLKGELTTNYVKNCKNQKVLLTPWLPSGSNQLPYQSRRKSLPAPRLQVPDYRNLSQVPEYRNLSQVPDYLNISQVPEYHSLSQVPEYHSLSQVPEYPSLFQVPELRRLLPVQDLRESQEFQQGKPVNKEVRHRQDINPEILVQNQLHHQQHK